MQTSLRHTIVLVSVCLGALSFAAAREASVKRNVNLRSDPSTDNPAIELIQAKSTVTLLDPAPQNGYYHVSSSPWMRGAPQSGFSRLILRISSRTSFGTAGRPGWP
jgi:hypothetical protein